MPAPEDNCPFCGSRVRSGAQSCPACDLPLLGAGGEHPEPRRRPLFDGAALFDEAFAGDEEFDEAAMQRHLATKRRGREVGKLRCVVVALNQAEAEMLCDMLRGEGVRCMMRSPETLGYGQSSTRCDVMVAADDYEQARQLLRLEPAASAPGEQNAPHLFTLGVVFGIVLVAAVVALLITLGA